MHSQRPSIPEPRGAFCRLPPSHYRVVVRKAQSFTERQIAAEFEITRKTVSSYVERARDKLGCDTNQEVLWLFYSVHAKEIWDADYSPPGILPPG